MVLNISRIIVRSSAKASRWNVGLPARRFILFFCVVLGPEPQTKNTTTKSNNTPPPQRGHISITCTRPRGCQPKYNAVPYAGNMKNEVKFEVHQITNRHGNVLSDTPAKSSSEETHLRIQI